MNPVFESATKATGISPEKLWAFLAGLAVYFLIRLWIKLDAAGYLLKRSRMRASRERLISRGPDLEKLQERAENIVDEVIAGLPDQVRAEATKVPCLFREWAESVRDDPALGLYKGFQPGLVSNQGGSIILFVGNIHRYCVDHDLEFDEEVRTTYLHELGHHLGWDEDDLEHRGLG